MIRVRYPNGQCIQYNDATTQLRQNDGSWRIYRAAASGEEERLFAIIQASAGVIVEWVQPCSVTNPIAEQKPESALETVMKHLRTLPIDDVKQLKTALRDFNARRYTWKS